MRVQDARDRPIPVWSGRRIDPAGAAGGVRLSAFHLSVVSAFRRTRQSPAKAGHYVLQDYVLQDSENCSLGNVDQTPNGAVHPTTTFRRMAESLGLESGVVRIAEYDARWPRFFISERQRILDRCGALGLTLEHVGGTSIPGMCAKPVIDIAAGRRHDTSTEACVAALNHAGYEHRGERVCRAESSFFEASHGNITCTWLRTAVHCGATISLFGPIYGPMPRPHAISPISSVFWRHVSLTIARPTWVRSRPTSRTFLRSP